MSREEFEKARDDTYKGSWCATQPGDEIVIKNAFESGANWAYEYMANEHEHNTMELRTKLKLCNERSLRTYDGMAQKADKYDELNKKLEIAVEALNKIAITESEVGRWAKRALAKIK